MIISITFPKGKIISNSWMGLGDSVPMLRTRHPQVVELRLEPTSPSKHSVHQGHHTYCVCGMSQYFVIHPTQWISKYIDLVNNYCTSWLKWGSEKFSFVTCKFDWVIKSSILSSPNIGISTCTLHQPHYTVSWLFNRNSAS